MAKQPQLGPSNMQPSWLPTLEKETPWNTAIVWLEQYQKTIIGGQDAGVPLWNKMVEDLAQLIGYARMVGNWPEKDKLTETVRPAN